MTGQPHLPLQFFCKQIIDVFQKAIANPDPASFLHRNKARTPLFMAESLARILAETEHGKKYKKAFKLFKKLEDVLGLIDDYDNLIQQFSKNKSIKEAEVNYFIKKRDKAIEKLNVRLINKEFYQSEFNQVLNKLTVNFNDKIIAHQLQQHIKQELEVCYRFYSECGDGFIDMENQVHEIRRKLRWISIYGESFNGSMVLEKHKTTHSWEKKFISGQSAADPYNTLPVHKYITHTIAVDQKAFYALNTVIDQLGEIKDKAFVVDSLSKAIGKTLELKKEEARHLALKHLKANYTETSLLKEAHELLEAFFDTYAIYKLLV